MIRVAQKEDVRYCMKYAPDFWSEIRADEWLGKLDIKCFSNYLAASLHNGSVCGWLYEESGRVYGGILFSNKIDCFTNSTVFHELFWFMHKSKRNTSNALKLLKTAEKHCVDNKIGYIVMANMKYPSFEKMDKFYKKMGYANCDYTYLKHTKPL